MDPDLIDVLHEFLFSDLQLQHYGTELHVEVVGAFQFPLIVLSDVQSVPKNVTNHNVAAAHSDSTPPAGLQHT